MIAKIKEKLAESIQFLRKHERNVILVIAFTCVFFLGFFAAKVDNLSSSGATITIEKAHSDFTILNPSVQPQSAPNPAVAGTAAPQQASACAVRGTASSKIYHLPGGAFYDRLQNPVCFPNEAAAQAAGFRKSTR